jgi:nitrogen fixation/metabolism regulation signal transduction histidine kinase
MKLRTKYILFVFILHLLTLVLTYFIFESDKVLFLVAEVFIIISIIISWNLYRQLIQPMKSLMVGLDAIRERDFNIKFSPTGKHEVDQLIGVYNQMIDQLRTERTLQEQQHFFLEKLVQTSPTGIIILNYDDQVQQVNPKALQILALGDQDLTDHLLTESDNELLSHILTLKSGEARVVKYNGASTYKIQKSHFVDRGFPRHFVLIEELTAEILAAEKNVYGKVIRMMAHEVNNTIGPVNSIIQSTLSTNNLWQTRDDLLKEALQVALDRNQNLNLFMRNFADLVKLPAPNKKQIELQLFIRSIIKLMEIRARESDVELLMEVPAIPVYILADEQQMEQALINIVKNGIEAVSHNGSVTLTINTLKRQLIITDTGIGITAQQSEHLFTPFFSTKKDGQGIGLTLVREIMMNHGFEFTLKTVADKQTEFTICF